MRLRPTVISTSVALALTSLSGCGGGGGGPGGNPYHAPNTVYRTVPYATPSRVIAVKAVESTVLESDSSALFTASLSGSGQELVSAGRSATANQGAYPNWNLNVFGWSNGQLVNKTNQWFSGTDNQITGTEPSVKFADFDGDGRSDMYVAPNTDQSGIVGSGWVFFNNGTTFTRVDLNLNIN